MSASPGRFPQLRWLQNVACVGALLGGGLLVALGLIGFGSYYGVWMVAAGAFVVFITVIVMTIAPLVLKMESSLNRNLAVVRDLSEAAAKQTTILEEIAANTRISDAAKSLARRDEELDSVRRAIRDELRNEGWETALYLIDEMERRFGYKEEAERSREELDEARNAQIQTRLAEAIEMIDAQFASHEWERAQAEIDRLMNALPDDARVLALRDRMKALKEQHKQELRLAWDDAVRRNDTDHAIDILKELDQYLSSAEAKALQDSARNVFKEKLLQLGIQFRFAVNERRWQDALTTGLELVRDFPNARMATEVREALDTLRERARQAASTEPTAASESH